MKLKRRFYNITSKILSCFAENYGFSIITDQAAKNWTIFRKDSEYFKVTLYFKQNLIHWNFRVPLVTELTASSITLLNDSLSRIQRANNFDNIHFKFYGNYLYFESIYSHKLAFDTQYRNKFLFSLFDIIMAEIVISDLLSAEFSRTLKIMEN